MSSYLPRLSLSRRGASPILPLHNSPRTAIAGAEDYDLSELSPTPDDGLLADGWNDDNHDPAHQPYQQTDRSATRLRDESTGASSSPKLKPRVLFTGPPPPVAASTIMPYKDGTHQSGKSERLSSTRTFKSVLFDHTASTKSHDEAGLSFEPDSIWRSLQRRERALQDDIQRFLDAQAAGLAAHLSPDGVPSSSTSAAPSSRSGAGSDAGTITPTGTDTFYSTTSTQRSPVPRRADSQAHSSIIQPTRSWATGQIIPVRQPAKRRLGLRGARSALVRALAQLADLKEEEDVSLGAALSERKVALARLRRLTARRDSVAGELRALEEDAEEPLAQELRGLGAERSDVVAEIADLEQRLSGLRQRKRLLEDRIVDVKSRREAGLSGYRGALREVDAQVAGMLRRPPIRPIDIQALYLSRGAGGAGNVDTNEEADSASVGLDFLSLRPERRTLGMAKDWWDTEVGILEKRRAEVDRDREALKEGEAIWKETIKVVSGFERRLQEELREDERADRAGDRKGKNRMRNPEEMMRAQLKSMAAVMANLEEKLANAELKGWNLLICAIGAELEAFRDGERMLKEALELATENDRDGDLASVHEQPQVQAELSLGLDNAHQPDSRKEGNALVDVSRTEEPESDSEVPHDLLVSHVDDHDKGGLAANEAFSHPLDREESSENEVPQEFLAEHGQDGDDVD